MQRVQKQGSESENAQRTAQPKFTSKSRENEYTNGIDDSPAMVAQRKKLNSLFGGAIQRVEDEEPRQGKFVPEFSAQLERTSSVRLTQTNASFPVRDGAMVQMKRVGYVPTVPGSYRGTTNIGYDGSGVPQGGKDFNGAQTATVRANNSVNGGGAAPVIGVGNHNASDVGGAALMERAMVSAIEPEVDHIVPINSGGANDYRNARVLSKTQNTGGAGAMPRPGAGGKTLIAYEDFVIGPTHGMASINSAGDSLDVIDAGNLATYVGIAPQLNVGGYSGANIGAMCGAVNGTNNGIDVA